MKVKIISIANDFTIYPGGRVPADGPFSGEEFRDQFLIPALEAREYTTIDFDGTRGYGSSFLEEAFGGLVRKGFGKELILKYFTFQSSRKGIIDEVKQYIDKASNAYM